MPTTRAEENYLKTIYHLERSENKPVNTNSIAKKMQTKASSATDMIKKLAEKKLAYYKKYQGVSLTELGKQKASLVIRKHRLWEVFLVEKLNFSWDEVHEVAEQLEHIQSKKLIEELDAFLEFPTHDPHGDPIPDAKGNITTSDNICLHQLEVGKIATCVGVEDSSSEFLRYLDRHHIAIGSELVVVSKEPFDDSMTIKINSKNLTISKTISNNLFVKTN